VSRLPPIFQSGKLVRHERTLARCLMARNAYAIDRAVQVVIGNLYQPFPRDLIEGLYEDTWFEAIPKAIEFIGMSARAQQIRLAAPTAECFKRLVIQAPSSPRLIGTADKRNAATVLILKYPDLVVEDPRSFTKRCDPHFQYLKAHEGG
jgi:hypothetical protein